MKRILICLLIALFAFSSCGSQNNVSVNNYTSENAAAMDTNTATSFSTSNGYVTEIYDGDRLIQRSEYNKAYGTTTVYIYKWMNNGWGTFCEVVDVVTIDKYGNIVSEVTNE